MPLDTPTAILITQIPIALAILWGAYELYLTRREFIHLLKTIAKKKSNRERNKEFQ